MTGKKIHRIRLIILIAWPLVGLLLLILIYTNGYSETLQHIIMTFLWSNFGVIVLQSILKHIEDKKNES